MSLTKTGGIIKFLMLPVSAAFLFSAGCAYREPSERSHKISAAKNSLNLAEKNHFKPDVSAGHYLDAASLSAQTLSGSSPNDRADAQKVYNRATTEMTLLFHSKPQWWNHTETFTSPRGVYRVRFMSGSRQSGVWAPDDFTNYLAAEKLKESSFRKKEVESGLGGELVGVKKIPHPRKFFYFGVGVAAPVTATVDFKVTATGTSRDATLILNDPTKHPVVQMDGHDYPLAADFAAPLAYYPNPRLLGIEAMLRPARYIHSAGIYMTEPYDPDRIPVLFVHGLISAPQMWWNMINQIKSDPVLRGRFQFWVFGYPSGEPILLAGYQLRQSLAELYRVYPRTKDMVVVSHSLGGIVSQLQVVNSGRVLWNGIFKERADKFYQKIPEGDPVKQALIYEANPHLKTIVFICSPHRGSRLATGKIGDLGIWLIKLPGNIIKTVYSGIGTSLELIAGTYKNGIPNSIQGLSPESPLLVSLDTLPIQSPFYSIIGNCGKPGPVKTSSDGVVEYWSSHLDGAQTELIVPYPHGCCEAPLTVAGVKSILHNYLKSPPSPGPAQKSEKQTTRS